MGKIIDRMRRRERKRMERLAVEAAIQALYSSMPLSLFFRRDGTSRRYLRRRLS